MAFFGLNFYYVCFFFLEGGHLQLAAHFVELQSAIGLFAAALKLMFLTEELHSERRGSGGED